MPIDLDLIHEFNTINSGLKLPWAYMFIITPIMAFTAYALYNVDKFHPGRRQGNHPMDTVVVLISMIAIISFFIAFNPLYARIAMGTAILILVIGVFAERKLAKEPLREEPVEIRVYNDRTHLPIYHMIRTPTSEDNSRYSRRLQIPAIVCAIALALVMSATFVPGIGTQVYTKQTPSAAAVLESEAGIIALTQGIERRYAVRVVEYEHLDADDHDDRVRLIDDAASGDPWDAPVVKIATESGTYGKYRVVYDKDAQQVGLLIEQDKKADAPIPESFER